MTLETYNQASELVFKIKEARGVVDMLKTTSSGAKLRPSWMPQAVFDAAVAESLKRAENRLAQLEAQFVAL